jgi:hypothetical protein
VEPLNKEFTVLPGANGTSGGVFDEFGPPEELALAEGGLRGGDFPTVGARGGLEPPGRSGGGSSDKSFRVPNFGAARLGGAGGNAGVAGFKPAVFPDACTVAGVGVLAFVPHGNSPSSAVATATMAIAKTAQNIHVRSRRLSLERMTYSS